METYGWEAVERRLDARSALTPLDTDRSNFALNLCQKLR